MNEKKTGTSIVKVINQTLSFKSKKSEVASIIWSDTDHMPKNQITPQLDKFENNMIRKKKFKW